MPEICLYEPWTMKTAMPEEIESLLKTNGKKRISYEESNCSRYNARTQGKSARLHPPTCSAMLKLYEIENNRENGAAGIQRVKNQVNYICLEYPLEASLCAMVYNYKNGRFQGIQKKEKGVGKLLSVHPGQSTGEEFLALFVYASSIIDSPLYDPEFSNCYQEFKNSLRSGSAQAQKILQMAYRCCDNLYQRLTMGTQNDIPFDRLQFQSDELESTFSSFELNAGVFNPNDCVTGKFQVLEEVRGARRYTIAQLKELYSGNWDVTEKDRIPALPENYLVSREAEEIIRMVTGSSARLFMMTGEAGTGKTTDARMIAQVLNLPYYVFTCGPGTDELDLLASTMPNMGKEEEKELTLPDLEDLQRDPASALSVLSGTYEDGIDEKTAFQRILNLVYEKGYEKAKSEKDFVLKESEIIKACRRPSVIEIQEPAMIEKPGTLTRLNSLFDDGAVTDLVNGEKIRRNPDTVVIMTTNLNYVGCGNFNQSVLSRMSLIQPKPELTVEEMMQRAMARTGFANEKLMRFMADTIQKIHDYLIQEDILDGVCGYRELESWVLTYLALKDLERAARIAVVSKASVDIEEQEQIMKIYIQPYLETGGNG